MRSVTPKNARLIPPDAMRVFKGVIFDVYQWRQEMFDGTHETFEMLKRPDTMVVIAVQDGKLVVIKEEQPGRTPYFQFPGGRHDNESETELQAAKRELREETGKSFKSWKLLCVAQPISKIEWFVYVFLATDFEGEQPVKLDAGEKIEAQLCTYDEALALIGNPSNPLTEERVLASAGSIEGLLALPEVQN